MKKQFLITVVMVLYFSIAGTVSINAQTYEAENATLSGLGTSTNQPGYSGNGFVSAFANVGNYVQFSVTGASSGSQYIVLRYANGGSSGNLHLYVNDIMIKQVSLPNTGGWLNVTDRVDNVTLNAGINTIKYQKDNGDGGFFNVDCLTLAGVSTVTGVTISPTLSMDDNSTSQLTAIVAPANAIIKTVTWTSSNPAVAAVNVNTNGLITGKTVGTATITATTDDGNKTATCDVTVTASGAIKYEAENATLSGVGKSTNQPGFSGNAFVSTFTNVGNSVQFLITVATAGSKNITLCYANGGGSDVNLHLYVNGTMVKQVILPDNGGWSNCTYHVDNVTLNAGDNTIKYQKDNGDGIGGLNVDYLSIPAIAVTNVTVTPTTLSIDNISTSQLTATVAPADATDKTVTWASSNTAIAKVSSNGLVTAVAPGVAVITVTSKSGKTAACNVTITNSGIIKYEAEDALLFGVNVATNHTGYTGTGFVQNVLNVGYYFQFSITGATAGSQNITLRYSNGAAAIRTLSLYVNGSKVRQVSFPNNGGWDTWADKVDNVTLNEGNNTIKYQIDSGDDGQINVDYLSLTSSASQTITFASLPTGKSVGDADFSPGAISATSGINAITYVSSNTAVATIVNGNIHIVGAGISTITASQAASTNYNAAPNVTQVITVSSRPLILLNSGTNTTTALTSSIADVTLSGIGTTLTIDADKTVNNLTIEPGAKLDLSTNSLTLTGDLTLKADKTDAPSIKVSSAMVVNGTMRLLKTLDSTKWYFMSFPCDVKIDDITLYSGTGTLGAIGSNWWIKYYDGASRATNLGTVSNWKLMTAGQTLVANKGYIISISNSLTGDNVLSFPLNKSLVTTVESAKTVPVVAYGEGIVAANHVGWNLVGIPYLSKFAGNGVGANYLTFNNGTTYSQFAKADVLNINPFDAFFIQANTVGNNITGTSLSFATDSRQLTRSSVETDLSDRVQLNFTTTTGSDKTNLIMDNNQLSAYEINQDLEKWLTTETDIPQVYSLLDGIKYAYNALPINSVVNLPIGYYTKNSGATTISVNAAQAPSLSNLLLKDNETGITTDLLISDYNFTANVGTVNSRFEITAQRIPTNIRLIDKEIGDMVISTANGKLIVSNLTVKTTVRVYDVIGHLVSNKVTENNSLEIPISLAGIYTVQIESGEKNWVKKILNQR